MAVVEQGATSGQAAAGESSIWDISRIPAAYWIGGLVLLFLPVISSDFILFSIFAYSLILGMIGLSLMFLAGYGGMVSLAQLSIAGIAGYLTAIFGTSAIDTISLGWPWWLTLPAAILIAVIAGTIVGALAVRTEGIYTIMITLALGTAFFYFANQNYVIFNGFSGFNQILAPTVFGINWRDTLPFYYLTAVLASLSYLAVLYVSRSPFGLALQGVRDNARRMEALGFNVTAHRIAAYTFASFIAAIAGVLMVWQTSSISPGAISVGPMIDILIIAVVGGLRHPIGPFIGALIFVLLRTFALDALVAVGLGGERFRLLIGIGFLLIVFWSSDGVLGLWDRWRNRAGRTDPLTGENREGD